MPGINRAWRPFYGAFQKWGYFLGISSVNDNNTYQWLNGV